jgi:hypothetical protein
VAAAGAAEGSQVVAVDQPAARLVKTGGWLVKHARYY